MPRPSSHNLPRGLILGLSVWLTLGLSLPAAASTLSAPTSAPPAPTQEVTPALRREARRLVSEIERSVALLRKLPVKRKLKVGVYSKKQLVAFMQGQLAAPTSARRLRQRSRSWQSLGLLPPNYQLLDGLLAMLVDQVAGLYDPESRRLRIMARLVPTGPRPFSPLELLTGSPDDQARFVLSHELVHALQDQHHNLRRLAKDRPGSMDLEIALSGLFEGDATAAGLAFMIQDRGGYNERGFFATAGTMRWLMKLTMKVARLGLMPDTAKLRDAPRALQERLLFPYSGGLAFVMKVGQRGGFAAIDALYKRPPLSTEQLLHPTKLIGPKPDWPIVLRLPKLRSTLGRGYRQRDADTLGELLIRVLLEDAEPGIDIEAAAAGWGGDRYLRFTHPHSADALIWLSTWDSAADAREFERALKSRTRQRKSGAFVARRDKDVLWLMGVPDKARERVIKRVFSKTKRRALTRLPR